MDEDQKIFLSDDAEMDCPLTSTDSDPDTDEDCIMTDIVLNSDDDTCYIDANGLGALG